MKQWEYKYHIGRGEVEYEMNEAGKEGWEAISVENDIGCHRIWFKREILVAVDDRVKLSRAATEWGLSQPKKDKCPLGEGRVIRRSDKIVTVMWDGYVTPSQYHYSFVEKV